MPRPKKEQPNHAGGLYEVKITTGKTLDGKLLRKSFYSSVSKEDARRQAEAWRVSQKVAEQSGEVFVEKDVTFERWAMKWVETYKKTSVDENTYRLSYLNTIEKHLLPYFGRAQLRDIRPVDVTNFYATKRHMSESMLKKMRLCLNGIFESAIENDLCYKNPAKTQSVSSEKRKRVRKILTDEQMEAMRSLAEGRMSEILILLETGLRRGELLGLQWSDIDFEKETISVNRSIADRKGGGIKINAPKWNSYRTNPLSKKALSVFRSLPQTSAYVFPNKRGEPQSPNTWSQKLQRFMNHIEDESLRVVAHDLRHTYGTFLRRRGVDIYSIQKIMGHKDIKVTTEIYVHNEIEPLRKALEKSL